MPQTKLQQWIEGCRRGVPSSQKKIYYHFFNYGMTICSRYAANEEEAREILNDGFIKVFTKIDKYSGQRSFKAWINTIWVNTAIDHFRKNNSTVLVVDLVHAQHLEVNAQIVADLSARELMDLVQELSPAYRMVFNLHAIEGFSHPEIARKLGISVGTSKSNLAKARLKLQTMIQSREEKKSKYG
ncbi:MAG: RNA polymerase sigma factor [Bacteroidota bacterium]